MPQKWRTRAEITEDLKTLAEIYKLTRSAPADLLDAYKGFLANLAPGLRTHFYSELARRVPGLLAEFTRK
jgi:hypothetical protein